MGPELVDGLVVGHPFHHHAAIGETAGRGLVELLRVEDRGARAGDGGRRVDHDQVVVLGAELHVVAAVGDRDVPVRVRQHLRGVGIEALHHVGHGGHQLHALHLEARDEAGPVGRAHPEGDDEHAAGRGPDHERQVGHQLGVHAQLGHARAAHEQLRAARDARRPGPRRSRPRRWPGGAWSRPGVSRRGPSAADRRASPWPARRPPGRPRPPPSRRGARASRDPGRGPGARPRTRR